MSKSKELNQEIEQLQVDIKEQRYEVIKTGGIAFLGVVIVLVAVYLIFSNLFTSFLYDGEVGMIAIGFGLLIIAWILIIKLKVKQRSGQARNLLERKTKSLEIKKEELERNKSAGR